jgi:hypothetical protein
VAVLVELRPDIAADDAGVGDTSPVAPRGTGIGDRGRGGRIKP